MNQYGVILFHTTSGVMMTERLLLKAGYKIKLIPTPREFSSDCGMAVRFDWDKSESIRQLLEEEDVEYASINRFTSNSR